MNQTTEVFTRMGAGMDALLEKMAETGRQNAEILTDKVGELLDSDAAGGGTDEGSARPVWADDRKV